MKRIYAFFLIALAAMSAAAQTSPDGRISVSNDGKVLTVTCNDNGTSRTVCTISIPVIGEGQCRKITEKYRMVEGKQLKICKKGTECTYPMADGGFLTLRLFNDGIAFRTGRDAGSSCRSEEPVEMDFSSSTGNWLMRWTDSYEEFFPKNRRCRVNDHLAYPALFEYGNGLFALLSESGVRADNAASSMFVTDPEGIFRIQPDENPNNPELSPWRVVIIGTLADIVESTLITDNSDPCLLDDTSWIEPGVASWIYWANNHGSNDYSIIRKYVDMAVELKLPYVLIDAEWDGMPDLPSNEGKTIEDAVKYAVDNGVKPLIWYSSSIGWLNGAPGPKFRLNKPEDREKEFAWCESIGIKGIKIDFFSGDTNENMKFMIDLMESAARHHLTVNFHGATTMRGWQRTYPNLVSTEAVYGAEWYNNTPMFTNRAAAHNATLPFTRNVLGSMDYTPCAFSDSQHPHITTNAHELALTALFESGLQHLADRPESFLAQPQPVREYLGNLPTAWDETHYISGYPGESAVLARRSGKTWYIAGINGLDESQSVDISAIRKLKIKGKNITLFADSGNPDEPWDIRMPMSLDELGESIECQPRGGFTIVVRP